MSDTSDIPCTVGVVAIGRNEGERLVRCLRSLKGSGGPVVYVDSGSTDGSPDHARSVGVEVVDLDMSIPFTAARARNAGLDHLCQLCADVEYVQFVDGDCEIARGWIDAARTWLDEHRHVAVVFGRRRECHREQTLYNAFCDLEWNTHVGEASGCGGDEMFGVDTLRQVGD